MAIVVYLLCIVQYLCLHLCWSEHWYVCTPVSDYVLISLFILAPIYHGWQSGAVVSTITSKRKGSEFGLCDQLGPFCAVVPCFSSASFPLVIRFPFIIQ